MEHKHACHTPKDKFDYLLWVSLTLIVVFYLTHIFDDLLPFKYDWVLTLNSTVYELINTMWWGILIGMLTVAILSKIPREFVISTLGNKSNLSGIIRATLAGVLLDLCSHGILMVGAKLYQRGVSAGQVIAFLVASPWNSFSLTIILIALIGLWWTLAFIFFSMVIAVVSGVIFEYFVARGTLPDNPNKTELPADFKFWKEAMHGLKTTKLTGKFIVELLVNGITGSKMVLRWILFGVLLAGLVRAFIDTESFGYYFGPTLTGLGLTVLIATIMEVCSEGSTPLAADLLVRAKAPGNSFAFLMTGVSTDYTEILILKDVTKSWKIALFLPLITVPQVIFVSWVINYVSIQ